MSDIIWQILSTVTAGGLLWLGILFLLAMLMELGLPATSPFFEGLLIFSGFEIAHGGAFVASLPFLAVAVGGRLCGSMATYGLSSSLGNTILDKAAEKAGRKVGKYINIIRERLDVVRQKLGKFALPSIIIARFTPGFSFASSIASGISRVGRKKFFAAVTIHVLAWELLFLSVGALGGRISKSFSPEYYSTILVVWIIVAIVIGTTVGYVTFRRGKGKT